ncbi:hypothetical protein GCK72_022592 [Caenorhabditis remanei]|uniref:Uncharacterized protein n=1 Tax=Caenorhabditis remanei TaxID=31234 RepID=A0A6A5FUI9_CAERE|nr:hypothetical protein GCK72_022592 [Caenorhabditis remanei]KAF1746139.1 hypothetical protein GCK72_022592 [Caenorhabditis remanei]
MSIEFTSVGFACEMTDDIVKIYTIEHGLIEMKNTGDLELGAWYDITESEIEPFLNFDEKICEVWEDDGEVFAKVLAIGPNHFSLPKDIRIKYKYAVWSPFLKFLDDGDNLFKDNIRGGDVVEIIVKYSPSEKHLFKIVDLIKEDYSCEAAYVRMAPWTVDFIGQKIKEIAYPRENSIALNQYAKIKNENFVVGVCINAEYDNVARPKGRNFADGGKEKCSYLFTPTHGLCRWVIKDMKADVKGPSVSQPAEYNVADDMFTVDKRLGNWVTFCLLESSTYRRKQHNKRTVALLHSTATKVAELQDPPKETRVVNGQVEMEASFLFGHVALETEENRLIKDWQIRFKGLSTDAHFWDPYLGRIEIYPNNAKLILQTIEAHRHNLDQQEAKKLENEAIVVSVTAIVHRNFLENFEKYPTQGVFVAKSVDTICYLNGGRLIYQK